MTGRYHYPPENAAHYTGLSYGSSARHTCRAVARFARHHTVVTAACVTSAKHALAFVYAQLC